MCVLRLLIPCVAKKAKVLGGTATVIYPPMPRSSPTLAERLFMQRGGKGHVPPAVSHPSLSPTSPSISQVAVFLALPVSALCENNRIFVAKFLLYFQP